MTEEMRTFENEITYEEITNTKDISGNFYNPYNQFVHF